MIKAVILAAGRGKRLLPLTKNTPKPLLMVLNEPLLKRTIDALKQAGINNYIIVTGYKAQAIRDYTGDGSRFNVKVQYSYNPAYDDGNATSLKTARRFLKNNEPFLLVMADHLIDKAMVKKALKSLERTPLLCVDRRFRYPSKIKDSTKVLVDSNGFIKDIGKDIPSWNAIDTGIFLLDNKIFQIIEQMETKKIFPLTVSQCIKQMITAGVSLWACDVSDSLWLDIDTPQDLTLAERLLGGFSGV